MTALREPSASEISTRASLLTDGRITDSVREAARQQLAVEPAPEPVKPPAEFWQRPPVIGEISAAQRRLARIVEELERVSANVGDALGARIERIRGLVDLAQQDAEHLTGDLAQGAYPGSLGKTA